MSNTPGVVTAVRWSELCPWLLLVRAARVALLVRVIVLAAAGVLATQWGWSAIEGMLLPERDPKAPLAVDATPLDRLTVDPPAPTLTWPIASVDEPGETWAGPLVRGWAWAIQPLTRLAGTRSWSAGAAFVLAGVWVMAVWALVGGAILRIAALYLARGEVLGPAAALKSSGARWVSTFAAPAFCFGVIAGFAVLLILGGLLIRWIGPLTLLAGLLWPVALALGAAAAIFGLGLVLGWPQMWATIAAERTDAFDGVSRGYAYTFQRPLNLVFYLLVASVLGLLAHAALGAVVQLTLEATEWGVSRGAGQPKAAALLHAAELPEDQQLGVLASAGGRAMRFWNAGLSALATSFPMAYLFSAAMGIYLLLRRSIDSTELSEVSLDDAPPGAGLPPLVADPKTGVPSVAPPAAPEAASATVTELRGGST